MANAGWPTVILHLYGTHDTGQAESHDKGKVIVVSACTFFCPITVCQTFVINKCSWPKACIVVKLLV